MVHTGGDVEAEDVLLDVVDDIPGGEVGGVSALDDEGLVHHDFAGAHGAGVESGGQVEGIPGLGLLDGVGDALQGFCLGAGIFLLAGFRKDKPFCAAKRQGEGETGEKGQKSFDGDEVLDEGNRKKGNRPWERTPCLI